MKIQYNKSGLEIIDDYVNSKRILLDPKRPRLECINVTTHGHTDHLPTRTTKGNIICSEITKKMIEFYKPKSTINYSEKYQDKYWDIKLYDAGHCLGSRMAFIKNKKSKKTILYTGDYNTIKKYCGQAKPKICDKLIVDSTYGEQKYIFPNYKKTTQEFLDHIYKNQAENKKTRILTYSFGKSQEICNLLDKNKIKFAVDNKISEINNKIKVSYKYNIKKSIILVATKMENKKEETIIVSGHAINKSYKYISRADKSYVISDHADFEEGVKFISKCKPKIVYTIFGKNKIYAKEIKKRLGIEAIPLQKQQRILKDFE